MLKNIGKKVAVSVENLPQYAGLLSGVERRPAKFRPWRLLPHVYAAVHVECGAGHIVVLDDKADCLGDLFGLSEAAERDGLEDALLNFLRYCADHVGLYKARRYRVDGDVVLSEFAGGGLGEAEQTCL